MKKPTTSFNEFAEIWDLKSGNKGIPAIRAYANEIIKLLKPLAGKTVYEIAAGNGFLARLIAKQGVKAVHASDIAPEMIRRAQSYTGPTVHYTVREGTNFTGLPKLDAIVLNQGIFYIKNVNLLFERAHEYLKKDGAIIFTIQHPLLTVFLESTKDPKASSVLMEAERYLSPHEKIVRKFWKSPTKEQQAEFLAYKRPLEWYTNLLYKHGFVIEQIIEPKSIYPLGKGVEKQSPIPSGMIIKAIKK